MAFVLNLVGQILVDLTRFLDRSSLLVCEINHRAEEAVLKLKSLLQESDGKVENKEPFWNKISLLSVTKLR